MDRLRLGITPGEPAGIGPDLVIKLAQQTFYENLEHQLVIIADPDLLRQRAEQLQLPITITLANNALPVTPAKKGELIVQPQSLSATAQPGILNSTNAPYVLDCLETATNGCLNHHYAAMITGPVQKSVINEAKITFSGHTEWLQKRCGVEQVVMMLCTKELRVALATTHLPLKDVSKAITSQRLQQVIDILIHDLQKYFSTEKTPRVLVAGLNPHAGEDGHLGREEIDTIIPALEQYQNKHCELIGPLPADTLFTKKYLENADAVLAMYHDQGLPVLKYQGFGRAANITLGLPIIRTSVDHGTALDLAGTGNIDTGSLETAINYAITMANSAASA